MRAPYALACGIRQDCFISPAVDATIPGMSLAGLPGWGPVARRRRHYADDLTLYLRPRACSPQLMGLLDASDES